ncbi:uncharacterized protein PHACADRAFT_213766 [Phanerochaete carnosa HHB-10118-sp]|uniref:glutathione transferase n=1 Tax=Phanerochaete carnosa (strain HHB-10118-sp) TaxID=650164 RepID=K5VTV0_PHACS|nr:uncharacterized protein PHACADRAFT_213766 [Phanerochaete carnosa HHB-10118-sp]EKM49994.1 hypothetical protein PHACADRAFT_213766 [Phanerochaete carnosa HHB-10118-sp]
MSLVILRILRLGLHIRPIASGGNTSSQPHIFIAFVPCTSHTPSMSHGKQFTLFNHKAGPNGWKVAFVLEELGLTYESVFPELDMKKHEGPESLTKFNPNGRIPALIDHGNNDCVIWESNAIIQYIVDKYDKERKISAAPGTDEYYTQLQWLYFQGTGQGPYYGQLAWFIVYHPEKVQSALDRYTNEVRRVLGVLEGELSKREWLVGNRPTVVDIAFFPWNEITVERFLENFDFEKEFPVTAKWHKKILERPAVKKVRDERAKLLAQK